MEGCPISMVSSTNCWWVFLSPPVVPLKPMMELLSLRDEIDLPKPSSMIINKKGDKGSPCIMTLEGLMIPEGTPFTRIEKKTEETRFITQLAQF